jgi:hypothetical protein
VKQNIFRFLIVLLGFLCVDKALAVDLTLDWSASASPNAAGYNVYYGTSSGTYLYKVDAGNATSATLSNLTAGVTYYFAATTYDGVGDESAYSSEVSFIVPGILTMNSAASPGGPSPLQFPVAPGHWYEVQASTDLLNWASIWQSDVVASNCWMQFTDPAAASYSSRFYRLVLH